MGSLTEKTDLQEQKHQIEVNTFGNFDIFVDGKLVMFTRKKAKELLAYLVDRKGASVSTAEACSVLWEDKDYEKISKNRFQHTKRDLKDTLKRSGIEDILINEWNAIAVDVSKLNCDYYDYLKGNPEDRPHYIGEYMMNYSWAEDTAAYLWRNS